ncbi:MAG: hypothetical protein U9R43_17880 [Thermodesulfobacteriota bacterium]|nr:hypothetical protein [Thermodesulfobacteriota bacterium]
MESRNWEEITHASPLASVYAFRLQASLSVTPRQDALTRRRARPRHNLNRLAKGEAWMSINRQERYQIWSGTTLISGTKI